MSKWFFSSRLPSAEAAGLCKEENLYAVMSYSCVPLFSPVEEVCQELLALEPGQLPLWGALAGDGTYKTTSAGLQAIRSTIRQQFNLDLATFVRNENFHSDQALKGHISGMKKSVHKHQPISPLASQKLCIRSLPKGPLATRIYTQPNVPPLVTNLLSQHIFLGMPFEIPGGDWCPLNDLPFKLHNIIADQGCWESRLEIYQYCLAEDGASYKLGFLRGSAEPIKILDMASLLRALGLHNVEPVLHNLLELPLGRNLAAVFIAVMLLRQDMQIEKCSSLCLVAQMLAIASGKRLITAVTRPPLSPVHLRDADRFLTILMDLHSLTDSKFGLCPTLAFPEPANMPADTRNDGVKHVDDNGKAYCSQPQLLAPASFHVLPGPLALATHAAPVEGVKNSLTLS
ncbi:hypothetical protein Pelo_11278 [Pelomyxa schiedti]|nr:hypothetical protein Pelo_11278 [Pelomyxa schiedti]